MVPIEEGFGGLDGFEEELVPDLLAEFVEAAAADVVLVGHAFFAPDVVAELEAGAEVTAGEEGRAEACAEGEDEFNAVALDGAVAGDIGVIAHAGGLLPALFEFGLEGETLGPEGMEVEGEVGAAKLDNAGEADGNAIEGGHELAQFIEAFEHGVWRRDGWSEDALAFADGFAFGVEEDGFEAGAADVDGHGDGENGLVVGVERNGRGGCCGLGSHQQ